MTAMRLSEYLMIQSLWDAQAVIAINEVSEVDEIVSFKGTYTQRTIALWVSEGIIAGDWDECRCSRTWCRQLSQLLLRRAALCPIMRTTLAQWGSASYAFVNRIVHAICIFADSVEDLSKDTADISLTRLLHWFRGLAA